MTKKLGVLIAALCMTGGVAYAADGDEERIEVGAEALKELPFYVDVDNSNPKRVLGLCDFIWRRDDMVPMSVKVEFEDKTDETVQWQPGPESGGGANGTGWDLKIEQGNTWGKIWTLTTSEPITKIWIDPANGQKDVDGNGKPDWIKTVFDIRLGAEITPGSENGHPFTLIPWNQHGMPNVNPTTRPKPPEPYSVIAVYENPIWVGNQDDPVPTIADDHDLYGKLHIEFEPAFDGTLDIPGPLTFRADTDCVLKVTGSITPTQDGVSVHAIGDEGDVAILTKDGEVLHQVTFGPDCSVCENAGVGQYRVEADLTVGPGEYTLEAVTADTGWSLVHSLSKK